MELLHETVNVKGFSLTYQIDLGRREYIIEVPVDGKMVRESSVAATITYTYLSTSSVFIAPRLQLFHLSWYSSHIPKETELLFNLICELEERLHVDIHFNFFLFLLSILEVRFVMKIKTMNDENYDFCELNKFS